MIHDSYKSTKIIRRVQIDLKSHEYLFIKLKTTKTEVFLWKRFNSTPDKIINI